MDILNENKDIENDIFLNIGTMKPVHLRIMNFYEQLGINVTHPFFSWQLESNERGKWQRAYRLLVSETAEHVARYIGDVYDSGKRQTDDQLNIPFQGEPLKSCRRYFWRVCVWDEQDHTQWSEVQSFVTGFMCKSEWTAQWIGMDTVHSFYARKPFACSKKVKNAFAYVCGLGQFVFWLNGKKVSDHVLDPGWTHYDKSIQYVTFDVSELLKEENVAGVSVGGGFYSGEAGDRHFYIQDKGYQSFGHPVLICEIHIEYEDGTKEVVASDSSWQVRQSATLLANVYGSEYYDARLYPDGWSTPSFLDNEWSVPYAMIAPKGSLMPQTQPPLIIKKTYDCVHISEPKQGVYMFDLGQNMSGQFEIFVSGRPGDCVTIKYGEFLKEDGTAGAPWEINTVSQYTLKGTGDIESWKPEFSYAGGRWVQIEGCTRNKREIDKPYIHDVKGHFITSAAEDVGEFKTDNAQDNDLHHIIVKAVESNLQSVHTDCPTIEKLGWIETAHLMGPSVMYNKDVQTLWGKIVKDMMDSQTEDGLIPTTAPEYERFETIFRDSPVWGASIVIVPYLLYEWYGVKSSIEIAYDSMKRYLAFLKTKEVNGCFLSHGLGDWGIGPNQGECAENVDTAVYYWMYDIMVKHANLLQKENDAIYFQKEALRIKTQYNKELLVINQVTNQYVYKAYGNGKEVRVTQANQALPLYVGITPDEKKEEILNTLLTACESNKIRSGEIGLRFILQVLSEYGGNNKVRAMMTQKEHPSYFRFVEKGETSLPEFWTDEARSRNHDMMGHILEWMHQQIGGISLVEPGFKRVKIAPFIPIDMKKSECHYDSIRGRIASKWEKKEESFILCVQIPPNVTADITIPNLFGQDPVLYEGETVIYKHNEWLADSQVFSILSDQSDNAFAILTTGSGSYKFKLQKSI
ncbi:family 78 glycoside hydrolase catalytic domain [Metabacillus halosaccharovorans]|uniref:family 78 glycoside hydrolase catalytic domain n=1 Tax=Metabacillus halosaccharovorans TaxID=930124 RepID=UPI001C1F2434|nr:family 78 glycoside hydrolase catalytic domain [Metabacillus halosaccharovorans]MBU7595731.1 Bacterial alpha-L-rhamnosidase [Metabacillus halosaccharovorans]